MEFLICSIVRFSPIAFKEVYRFHPEFINGMVEFQVATNLGRKGKQIISRVRQDSLCHFNKFLNFSVLNLSNVYIARLNQMINLKPLL